AIAPTTSAPTANAPKAIYPAASTPTADAPVADAGTLTGGNTTGERFRAATGSRRDGRRLAALSASAPTRKARGRMTTSLSFCPCLLHFSPGPKCTEYCRRLIQRLA